MQLDLASASEAEKSAVLAITDQDSQTFADLARAASAKVEQERRELEELLATTGGTQGERELLAQFAGSFAEFQRIDSELLALAVQNTNLKAYSLAFGPAAGAIKEMNASLSRLVAADTDSPEARSTMLLAFGAQTSALASEQETHHGSDHCCRLCHIGPIPILPSAAVAIVAPVFSAVWVAPPSAPGAPREVLLASAPSRAPPA